MGFFLSSAADRVQPSITNDPDYVNLQKTYKAFPVVLLEYIRRIEERLLDNWYRIPEERTLDQRRLSSATAMLQQHDSFMRELMIKNGFFSNGEGMKLGEGGVVLSLEEQVGPSLP